jgi:hypothetical protein
MRKVVLNSARSIAMLWLLSCASSRPTAAGVRSLSQGCPSKSGMTEASVSCRAGFVPDCGCAADGQAFCHCVAASR